MQSKKGAIELSMTTIIVIVIGVTLLILGLAFVTNIFDKGQKLVDDRFQFFNDDLQSRMGASEKMYIAGTNLEIESGGSIVMSVGIQNFATNDETTSSRFKVAAEPGNEKSNILKFEQPPELMLDVGEKKIFPLKIETPKGAVPGTTYSVLIKSYKNDELYDTKAILISIKE